MCLFVHFFSKNVSHNHISSNISNDVKVDAASWFGASYFLLSFARESLYIMVFYLHINHNKIIIYISIKNEDVT